MPRAWILLLLTFLIAGCGPKLVSVGGEPLKPPFSVVSLSPSTTEILALNGMGNQLQGRTAYCNHPPFVTGVPIFAGVKPDYEKLAKAKPELIVYDKSLYSEADRTKLKELGFNILEIQAHTIDEFEMQLMEFGKRIGSEMNISQYIDKINAERRAAQANLPSNRPKVATLSGTLTAGTKSFVADVIRTCGGEPVGPDSDRFVDINPETLIQSNPDLILLAVDIAKFQQDPNKQRAAATAAEEKLKVFMADPRYKAVKAVQSKHVYPVDADVLLRQGSRVEGLIKAVASVIRLAGTK